MIILESEPLYRYHTWGSELEDFYNTRHLRNINL
jgi:hypothetical protein